MDDTQPYTKRIDDTETVMSGILRLGKYFHCADFMSDMKILRVRLSTSQIEGFGLSAS